jgi:signal transduction histidine kinase
VEIALEAASDISTTSEKYHLIEQKLADKNKHYSRNPIQIVSSVAADVKKEYPEASINCAVGESKCIEVTDGFTFAIEEIIVNAIEHSDRPEPQIKITTSESPDDPYLEIKIMDNGPGIKPEQAAIIEQAREVNQSTEHLNGLGLWAVRWVIQNCEGSLSFEANNPRGTVVTLRMPHCEHVPSTPK